MPRHCCTQSTNRLILGFPETVGEVEVNAVHWSMGDILTEGPFTEGEKASKLPHSVKMIKDDQKKRSFSADQLN